MPQIRGGTPVHVNGTTNGTGVEEWNWSGGSSNYFYFQNNGAGDIVLSFTAADAAAGTGITVATGVTWEGPLELGGFYTKSAVAYAFAALILVRRG